MTSETDLHAGKNVVALCHSNKVDGQRIAGCGPIYRILDYFTKHHKARYLFVIDQPHPHRGLTLKPTMEVYEDGQLIATHEYSRHMWLWHVPDGQRHDKTYIRLKVRDIISARHFFGIIKNQYTHGQPLDYLFGVESINSLIGSACRKKLPVKNVLYYIIDWAPRRFPNPVLNWIYVLLDRLACQHADFVWNQSETMEIARRDVLKFDEKTLAPQLTVLFGTDFRQDAIVPLEEMARHDVIFTGGITEVNGAHLLPAIARHLHAKNSKIRLVITVPAGGHELLDRIKREIADDNLGNVKFLGYVADEAEFDRITAHSAVGLAPYPNIPYTMKPYGDVSKVRTYFACGIVVVCTRVPPIWQEIEDERLGIATAVDPEEMADAIVKLCTDDELYAQMRDNVIRKAKAHDWVKIYDRTFVKMNALTQLGNS